jgi:DNA-binding phage protein
MNVAAPLTRDARRVLNQLGDAVADAGWTATARRSGVDRVTLHRLFGNMPGRTTNAPNFATLCLIAEALGLELTVRPKR